MEFFSQALYTAKYGVRELNVIFTENAKKDIINKIFFVSPVMAVSAKILNTFFANPKSYFFIFSG